MRRLLSIAGIIFYYATYPALCVLIYRSNRTRVIIENNGKILVLKSWHSDGSWQLPGGGLHRNEPPIIGAIRESREETGIVLEQSTITELGSYVVSQKGVRYTAYFFKTSLSEMPEVTLQMTEISHAQWFTSNELKGHKCSPDVLYALSVLDTPVRL